MKKYNAVLLLFIIMPFLSNRSKEPQKFFEPDKIEENKINYVSGTLPAICSVLPGSEIEALHIFNNSLTKTYTETATTDVLSTCRYEFFKPNDYPSLTITLVKFDSKEEAAAIATEAAKKLLANPVMEEFTVSIS